MVLSEKRNAIQTLSIRSNREGDTIYPVGSLFEMKFRTFIFATILTLPLSQNLWANDSLKSSRAVVIHVSGIS